MRLLAAITAAGLIAAAGVSGNRHQQAIQALGEHALRQYTGAYRWDDNTFVYLQMWDEFSGFNKPSQLVAFDESGEVRVLNPSDRDQFFTGPGAGISTSVESRVVFERNNAAQPTRLIWRHEGSPARTATRV